jgi:hypothetical protein
MLSGLIGMRMDRNGKMEITKTARKMARKLGDLKMVR